MYVGILSGNDDHFR